MGTHNDPTPKYCMAHWGKQMRLILAGSQSQSALDSLPRAALTYLLWAASEVEGAISWAHLQSILCISVCLGSPVGKLVLGFSFRCVSCLLQHKKLPSANIEDNLTLGGEYTMQYTDRVS